MFVGRSYLKLVLSSPFSLTSASWLRSRASKSLRRKVYRGFWNWRKGWYFTDMKVRTPHLVMPRLVSNMRRNSAVAEWPRIEAQSADLRPMSFWKRHFFVMKISSALAKHFRRCSCSQLMGFAVSMASKINDVFPNGCLLSWYGSEPFDKCSWLLIIMLGQVLGLTSWVAK